MKRAIIDNLKNIPGWRTKRKIVVISVDDYGNVRLDSKKAREAMDREGVKVKNRFDAYDTLETKQDLDALYSVLTSVNDKYDRHALFTPFAVPCNIDFEKMAETGYKDYHFEMLPVTYEKLTERKPEAYGGAWDLWKKGIDEGLMVPQFHGREHLNLTLFEEKLAQKDNAVLTALKNRSYTSITSGEHKTVSSTAAFDFWEFEENERFEDVIRTGLDAFESVYGYRSVHFTPPVYNIHPVQFPVLKEEGVEYIDVAMIHKVHQGRGKYKTTFNYTGKKNSVNQYYIVRNVVFEPSEDRGISWVDFTMKQIEAAFRWNRPAVISSHRVNFCGHIDPKNREKGLDALKELLKRITVRWPEVEFMAANELGDLVAGRST